MKRAIITGAGGFVGKNLTSLLAQSGVEVYAIVHRETEYTKHLAQQGNIHVFCADDDGLADMQKELQGKDVDVFYHLAWDGGTKNAQVAAGQQLENTGMSIRYLELAKQLGCGRFVGIGTVNENLTCQRPLVKHPRILYALAKDYTGKVLSHMARLSPEIQFVWCRLSSVYGRLDVSSNLVNYTVTQLLAGQAPEYSEGAEPYNFVYIDDVTGALKQIGESSHVADRPVFIGGIEIAPLRELLVKIQQIVAPEVPMQFGVRPPDGITYQREWFSIDILKQDYGFTPHYSLESGISALLRDKQSGRQGRE